MAFTNNGKNKGEFLMDISVVGLGKLGACTAACFALGKFDVLGVDINEKSVDRINNFIAPVDEPFLEDILNMANSEGHPLTATTDHKRAITETDITFIIVPTPSLSDHTFSDSYIKKVFDSLIPALVQADKDYHLFVIVSTIMPGTTDKLYSYVKYYSDYKLNSSKFGIVYNPEFIAIGSVIKNFLQPDIVLIGSDKIKDANRVKKIYEQVCENKPHIALISSLEAEIAKIALNCFVTMKISFANLLLNICSSYDGSSTKINVDNITNAIGADKRVSLYYLKGGLGFGGPCFPRDTKSFKAYLSSLGLPSSLPEIIDELNAFQTQQIVNKIMNLSSTFFRDNIAILGLSYKAGTHIITDSPSLDIIDGLLEKNLNITVYDKFAIDNVKAIYGSKLLYASSVKECFNNSNIIVVALPEEYLKKEIIECSAEKHNTILDCWRIFNKSDFKHNNYVALGAN